MHVLIATDGSRAFGHQKLSTLVEEQPYLETRAEGSSRQVRLRTKGARATSSPTARQTTKKSTAPKAAKRATTKATGKATGSARGA